MGPSCPSPRACSCCPHCPSTLCPSRRPCLCPSCCPSTCCRRMGLSSLKSANHPLFTFPNDDDGGKQTAENTGQRTKLTRQKSRFTKASNVMSLCSSSSSKHLKDILLTSLIFYSLHTVFDLVGSYLYTFEH